MRFDDFVQLSLRKGYFWFSDGAMSFFSTRVCETTWNGDGLFVTSDRRSREPRLYTIRRGDLETGKVETVGVFQQYPTRKAAIAALKTIRTLGGSERSEAYQRLSETNPITKGSQQ